jgi:hypothetical protein
MTCEKTTRFDCKLGSGFSGDACEPGTTLGRDIVMQFLEVEMKTRHLIGSLAALAAITAAGSALADLPGIRDGADQFSGFKSNTTRADVQDELRRARADGLAATTRIDGDESDIGAHGVAGSRYSSMRTRDDVRSELKDQSWSHSPNTPNMPGSLYFGD